MTSNIPRMSRKFASVIDACLSNPLRVSSGLVALWKVTLRGRERFRNIVGTGYRRKRDRWSDLRAGRQGSQNSQGRMLLNAS